MIGHQNRRRLLLLLCLVPWLSAGVAYAQASPSPARSVLLIYPHEQEMASYATLDRALRSSLQSGVPYPIDYYSEYLDLLRFSDAARVDGLVDYLRAKYAGRRIDLVIVVSSLALEFVLQRGEELFPHVPIVFASVNVSLIKTLTLRPNITGIAVRRAYGDTVDMILELQPDTREIVVPLGVSVREKAWASDVRETLEPYRRRVALTYLTDLSMSQVLARVRALPRHAVVLFSPLFFTDAAGRYYLPAESLRLITEASAVPVYGTDDHHLGAGIVGGALYDISVAGAAAGRLGQRILSGESVARLPVQTINPSQNRVDARQLTRWGISETRLPPGTLVSYRTTPFWAVYRGYVLAFVTVLLLQASLIVLLVLQRRRLTRSQSRLRELSARLITAQEEERKRIARELHDDFGQRVAALRIELGMLAREDRGPRPRGAVGPFLHVLSQTDELATDLRDLSHRLHSSRLQHLGLPAALEDLCSALGRHQPVSVTLDAQTVAVPVPTDVALCLYRVAQEALHNAAHHGAAPRIVVSLSAEGSLLRMQISDTGRGFDTNQSSEGIGLASMRERLHMIGGELTVQSKPGRGTALTALVDLRPQDPSASRAESA